MKAEERICAVCGNEFIATRANAKYCSEECLAEGLRMRTRRNEREKAERKREERKRRKESQKAIIDIAVEAKKAGMSYGQYVAVMGL